MLRRLIATAPPGRDAVVLCVVTCSHFDVSNIVALQFCRLIRIDHEQRIFSYRCIYRVGYNCTFLAILSCYTMEYPPSSGFRCQSAKMVWLVARLYESLTNKCNVRTQARKMLRCFRKTIRRRAGKPFPLVLATLKSDNRSIRTFNIGKWRPYIFFANHLYKILLN